jgi:esterase/lipase
MAMNLIRRLTGLGKERPFRNVSGLPGTLPIFVEGRPPTVLCLHGFTGVPGEVQLACDAARTLGLSARAPLLAGHSTWRADADRSCSWVSRSDH